MRGIIVKFETTEPVKFKEKGCDTEFSANISGTLYVNNYDGVASYGATEDEVKEALAKIVLEKAEEHLSKWSERDEKLYTDGENILKSLLFNDVQALGIGDAVRINYVKVADEANDLYQEQIIKPIRDAREAEFRKKLEEADVPHGPLIKLSYDLSSHSMTPTGGSSCTRSVEWKKDGSVIYTNSSLYAGKNVHMEYKVTPEVAQKIRDYIAGSKLPALANMPARSPDAFDNFTSVKITMTFDDSSIGGDSCNLLHYDCGPAGMYNKTVEEEISALLKECEETGECIKNELYDSSSGLGGLMGLNVGMMGMNVGMMGGTPAGVMGGAPAAPSTPAPAPATSSGAAWTCTCGTQNYGKFCAGCGSPKPQDATWTCSCGAENKSKFCSNCGSPRPA